jgi:hypothetical protein
VSSATEDAARHMDGIYRYQRYIYTATRKYYLLGGDRLLNELQPDDGSIVLEILAAAPVETSSMPRDAVRMPGSSVSTFRAR